MNFQTVLIPKVILEKSLSQKSWSVKKSFTTHSWIEVELSYFERLSDSSVKTCLILKVETKELIKYAKIYPAILEL